MQTKRILKLPVYRKYQTMTSESLNTLVNLYRLYINSKYIDYSDGIIEGFNVSVVDNESFNISGGIFKKDSVVYILDDKLTIKRPEVEGRYALILEVEKIASKEYEEYEISIFFKETSLVSDENFVLFNIILRDGANIFEKSNEFLEYEKEFNVIDLTNQKYAVKDSNFTLNFRILEYFCEEMEKFDLDDFDFNMCMLLKNTRTKRDVLISYINKKLNLNEKNLTNSEIRNCLFKILKSVGSNGLSKKTDNENIETFSVI